MSVQALIAAIISGNFQIKTGIENSIKKASIVCHNPYFSIDTFISSLMGLKSLDVCRIEAFLCQFLKSSFAFFSSFTTSIIVLPS